LIESQLLKESKMKNRIFTSKDQISFAELSGDYNPLHVDAIHARRLLFGSQIVHGIHSLLWALDFCLENISDNVELCSIKASFSKPIELEQEVSISLANEEDKRFKINLLRGKTIVSKMEFELGKPIHSNLDLPEPCFPKKLKPRVMLNDEKIEADSGSLDLCLNVQAAKKMFPNLIRCVTPMQIAVILGTTRLVGVICPGLHSVYSKLELSSTTLEGNKTLNYEVTKFDKRFNLVNMKVIAPKMVGTITAFRRPEPQSQANSLTLKKQVSDKEFADQRAIIIGGSRGLGEVAAKLLSAGDADVKITYQQGKEDAFRIVDDIVSNGGIADSFHFDILNPQKDLLDDQINNWPPTHLYFFATPFVFSGDKGKFSPKLFNKFCEYYVSGFINTVNIFSDFGIRFFFYPSSVAIDEVPANMGEYTAAKYASEMLCTFLEKSNRKMSFYKPRFPRVATDQTASIMPVTNQDPVPIMLKELRLFHNVTIDT
jgi:acyl dehydratase